MDDLEELSERVLNNFEEFDIKGQLERKAFLYRYSNDDLSGKDLFIDYTYKNGNIVASLMSEYSDTPLKEISADHITSESIENITTGIYSYADDIFLISGPER